MAAKVKVKLNPAGMQAMLKSRGIAQAVHARAEEVAARARQDAAIVRHELQDAVDVEDVITDRAVSIVAIAHPAGRGIEGKHSSLTKAVTG
ncbi:hypothetical protein HPO96_36975 [Kribbella sandramycini]|uniref:Uncharacterized protein n=1 Tax=Kribbella sandramycini TaxID=60450 RepID=A0A7Y4L7P8_9ACTN|nr:hypothetical protein [Kribbella sandramycini]MBB6564390.1 hypothetical protein [Kribbella sandramycini]NOL45853.1 hypothetical protein [Kribbella sandramycini]